MRGRTTLGVAFLTVLLAFSVQIPWASADLAVASFGVTAYELAAVGVPAVYLCLTDDHAESAEAFSRYLIPAFP